jgi:MFS family permease
VQGGLLGRLVKRFGERALVVVGFAGMAIGYGILGMIHVVPLLLVATTFASLGNALLRPALSSLVTHQAGPREQGVVLGLTQSLMSVAQVSAPLIGGLLIGQGLLSAWALVASSAAGIGLLLVTRIKPVPRPAEAKPGA